MAVEIDENGAGFVIRQRNENGLVVSELKLTGADVLVIAQSAQTLKARILERLQPPGGMHGAVFSTPVEGMNLSETSLADALLLTLRAPNGAETTYTLEPELAAQLAERLAARLSILGKDGLTKQ